jgi:hypothetical protein
LATGTFACIIAAAHEQFTKATISHRLSASRGLSKWKSRLIARMFEA